MVSIFQLMRKNDESYRLGRLYIGLAVSKPTSGGCFLLTIISEFSHS